MAKVWVSGERVLASDLNNYFTSLIGMITPYAGASAPTGWLICNGDTIGDASSGGTARANADTETLFTLLWTDYTDARLPIYTSAGGASTRGASAALDWAAHKRMSLPNLKGRVIVGKSTDTEFDAMGETGGEKTHVLTVAELAPHHHTVNSTGSGGYGLVANPSATPLNTSDTGSGDAHNNLQPYWTGTILIRY